MNLPYFFFFNGKSLSKFYSLGLVEFLYSSLNITVRTVSV